MIRQKILGVKLGVEEGQLFEIACYTVMGRGKCMGIL